MKNREPKEKQETLDIPKEKYYELCEKLEKKEQLSSEDLILIQKVLKAYVWVVSQLELGRLGMGRLKKLLFGEKSEKKDKLFKEKPSDPVPPPPEAPVQGHGRTPAAAFTGAKSEYCKHEVLKVGDKCPACGKGALHDSIPNGIFLRFIGNPPVSATVYETERLRCGTCGKVYEAKLPAGVPAQKWDETAVAMVALSRFGYGVPHYRLEKWQLALGIPISDSVFSQLSMGLAADAIPIAKRLIEIAADGTLIHADDTMMRILELIKENKKRDPDKERVGMFTTAMVSTVEDREIALFFTGRKHCGENLKNLLELRSAELSPPKILVDGSSRNMPEDFTGILINCLTHGRRNFVGLENSFPGEVKYVIELLGKVYYYDAEARRLMLDDISRLKYHQEHSGPLMEELKNWCHNQIETRKAEPNSGLGKAIFYLQKRWGNLTMFLQVPGAPLTNDIVERLIKRCVLHRKNSMFYKTQEGAIAGDTLMTLIHTATRCGVNPFHYLTQIQIHAENVKQNPGGWLPWTYHITQALLQKKSN